ncbi:MAG: hypothetical protein DMG14_16740 [Acidobacteria bacterium]|nr:MAG: hypothetical protein DMG14_16740 [Acidobacteriota bacterium]
MFLKNHRKDYRCAKHRNTALAFWSHHQMSWLRIAADLLREAMNSSSEPEPVQEAPLPVDISGVIGILNRHRSEIDKNFKTVAEMLNAQNERHLKAIQIQRRWNYGLTTAVVVVAILAIASYWRG